MIRRLTQALALTGFCLLLANGASAQSENNYELNVFGGGSIYTRNNYETGYPQSATPIPGQLKIDPHVRVGLRLGVYSRGHWGEELFYSFEPNRLHIANFRSVPTRTDLHIQIHNYGVNTVYYLREVESHTFQPFLSAGIGGTVYALTADAVSFVRDPLRGDMADMDNSHELTFNWGFGFKTRPMGWLGFRADVRDYIGRSPSFGLARTSNDPAATVLPASGGIHNGEGSVGVVFYFGKRR